MKSVQPVSSIPEYLRPFITQQDFALYTPIDHAGWRFILKISRSFLSQHAHQKYLDGLAETGISVERIPRIEEMSHCLQKFGWQAVAVSGFIPPAVFMEFLSLGVLPIACDMRKRENLAYTPAPDIVHEAAGHAPIIADEEYADYLRSYGEISQKAIFSREDLDVYHAIRNLSEVKEDPRASYHDVEVAQRRLDDAVAAQTYESEATLLARMGWWTFEYGLVGDFENPKIYGAGLLSSVGESYHCLENQVQKIPFSVSCVHTSYDITRPQPQLFVAPSFQVLKEGLEELGNQMAFRIGGIEGLEKAKQAGTVTTTVLDTGLEISSCLADVLREEGGRPSYLRFVGPTQLSLEGCEIQGQGGKEHPEGFGTPLEEVTDSLLEKAGLSLKKFGKLSFPSKVTVEGQLIAILRHQGRIVLLTFENCTVRKGEEFLFKPEWGRYDMACGAKVVSVFGGPADRKKYLQATDEFQQTPQRQKTNWLAADQELNELYLRVREIREQGQPVSEMIHQLHEVSKILDESYPEEWLLRYELLELCIKDPKSGSFGESLRAQLLKISEISLDKKEMIQRGLKILTTGAPERKLERPLS